MSAPAAAPVTLDAIVARFEQLAPADIATMDRLYAPDAWFRDPFNEVRGVPAIAAIFERMFEAMHAPRFVVVNRIVDGDQAMLEWDFVFRIRRFRPDTTWTIHGTSHLRFAPDGRIAYHRDYWDTGEELYAKLPLIGGVIRFLRARMG
ncbi:MAG: nuclear transport factor 2 family protein [Burkholderiales bacterium]|nr:nuclear transport factor 2 family protein [Burkholderiales bacterium]